MVAAAGPAPALPAGRSPRFTAMLDWVRRIAPSRLPVMILGESGAGKESVARAVHALSRRREGPFVAVNCAALTETLLDVELFGASRGAYTGADRDRPGLFHHARGGTLFLDEVGDMALAMQSRLLRALESRRVRPVGGGVESPVDVRLVTATNRDLHGDVVRGGFRADLFYRLAVVEVRVPPLRERLDDLPVLLETLGPRIAVETGQSAPRLAPCAWRALREHDWPGNVRELHGALARAVLRAGGATITAEHLQPLGDPRRRAGRLERQMIQAALETSSGNLTAAARQIGWSRQKLRRRMESLQIPAGGAEGT